MANPNPGTAFTPGGLYDRLLNQATTSTLGMQGSTPAAIAETYQSVLHKTYSINGIPTSGPGLDQRIIGATPNPSIFDLDGTTPPKYWDNRPR